MNVQSNCEPYHEDLQAYLDDELPKAERVALAEHIAACPDCRAILDDLKAVSKVLAGWTAPEPVGLPTARELLALAASEAAPEGVEGLAAPVVVPIGISRAARWTPAARWGAAAAAAVLAGAVGLTIFRTSTPENEQMASAEAPRAASPASPAGAASEPGGAAAPFVAQPPSVSASNTSSAAPASPSVEKQAGSPNMNTGSVVQDKVAEPTDDSVASSGAPAGNLAVAPPAPAPAKAQAGPPADAAPAATMQPKPMIAPERDREAKKDEAGSEDAPSGGGGATARGEEQEGRRAASRAKTAAPTQTASVRLEARASQRAVDRVQSAATAAGGSVQSRASSVSGSTKTTRLVLRIPADRLASTLAAIRGVGHVTSARQSNARADGGTGGTATVDVTIVESSNE